MNNAQDVTTSATAPDQPGAPQDSHIPRSKMTGSDELREHDFPADTCQTHAEPGPAAINTGLPAPETVRSGGAHGTVRGDRQAGAVGAIMDQDLSDPDDFADR